MLAGVFVSGVTGAIAERCVQALYFLDFSEFFRVNSFHSWYGSL
jgi:hypothetical protein